MAALEPFLHRTALMDLMARPLPVVSRPVLVAALGLLPFGLIAASAQSPSRPAGEVPYLIYPPPTTINPGSSQARPSAKGQSDLETLKQRDQELEALRAEQKKAIENEARLRREIDAIGDDRQKFNQQLIDTAARVRGVEVEIAKTEERLKPLDEREQGLRQSLESRRSVIAEVLAALQRIGRHPPPVIMVRPEDALHSVRSAMMLGAVLPDMRHEAEALVADLNELMRVRKEIDIERANLTRDLAAIADDRLRLSLLIDQRQKQQVETEQALAAERQRAIQLARQADDLKDLVAKLEQGRDKSTRGSTLASLKDPGRLGPAVAFASAKGSLPLPVNGARIRQFGAPDGVGGTEKGLSIATRPGAQVTAPCDGWVVYSGTFRNYGQLLILNAGGGYHVLLAGMDRISVDLGQFVVTGEPVAMMGGGRQTAAALAIGSGQPVLYVEFRKDGTPVDPGPWWAASEGEKVRG
jgi:septal ring factor EnvC (AmiA/AmiB activator)